MWSLLLGFVTGGFGWVVGIAKAIPLRAWLIIAGVIAVAVAVLSWNAHERAIGRAQDAAQIVALATRVKTLATDLDTATNANAAFDGTIKGLKLSLATCESGRLADNAATAAAQARYATQVQGATRDAAQARAATAALLAGRCKASANEAFCGAIP